MAIDVVINQRHLQIQLKQLETVWHTVVNSYNLSQAADLLHTSQSSLSKQIAALESQLKADVFTRQGKRLTGLTPIGKQLLPHIEAIFAEIRTIENLSLDFNNAEEGTLIVATTHTQARYVLPKIVKQFRDKFPKVNLVLQQADPETIAHMVIRGQADVGIATESLLNNSVLRCHRYYDWSHVVVVPKNHELAKFAGVTDGVDLPNLASYPIITYHGGFTGRGAIDKTFAKAGLSPDIVLSALDADVISTYVSTGLGVGIIAEMAYEPSHYPDLVAIPVLHFGRFTSWIAVRDDSEIRQFGQEFIKLCQNQFR
ncbi:LysR substrate-binding domain-containing protein [Moraxella nasovis]|uniref:LysR substrate-binding domain-containing protein n=1 Tax=Moraxella nasovis TaxID=2904121 RepID=UPI001F61A477|nr:LysR substrate-binding domain-containing protein [Moraxella nasovis]UNU73178.1 LysR substrate-binding domain-containing protein [Moraxella nasovis]